MQIHHPTLRRGKTDARPGAMMLKMSKYIDRAALPKAPARFGHDGLIPGDWGMLGNDSAGCCVFSGGGHETMLWNREAGRTVPFSTVNTLSDYSALTGYDPSQTDANGNNPTDRGADMVKAAEYRRTVGLLDANGNRHKVAASLALDPGSLDDIWVATYLFGAVGLGLQMPSSAEDQFAADQEWTYVRGAAPAGGHYVPLVSKADNLLHVVTWGRVQPMSVYYYEQYGDEAVAYVSTEALANNKSLEGFDQTALVVDLGRLKAA